MSATTATATVKRVVVNDVVAVVVTVVAVVAVVTVVSLMHEVKKHRLTQIYIHTQPAINNFSFNF